MDTFELQRFLNMNTNNGIIMKVCAIDQIPKTLKKNKQYGLVINLSKSSEIGSHWTSVFIDNHQNATWFCSYAFKPRGYHIKEFINKNCKTFSYNSVQLQQLNSTVCGMYATLFILHMMNGGTLSNFTNQFSKNLLLNDIIIQKWYKLNKKK